MEGRYGYEGKDRDQRGQEGHSQLLDSCSLPQGLLEHVLICDLMWECRHHALVLLRCLADDLVGLPVPRPTAAGHLPVECREGGIAVGANITGLPIRHSEHTLGLGSNLLSSSTSGTLPAISVASSLRVCPGPTPDLDLLLSWPDYYLLLSLI